MLVTKTKFIIPAIIIFFVVLFWEKINEKIYKKFGIKSNSIIIMILVTLITAVLVLLYF
jgi:hypothetical protein